jgi:hypothetical protein
MMNLEPPSPAAPSCSNCDHAIQDEVREHHQCILFTAGAASLLQDPQVHPSRLLLGWDGTIPTPAIIKLKPLWTGKQMLSIYSTRR